MPGPKRIGNVQDRRCICLNKLLREQSGGVVRVRQVIQSEHGGNLASRLAACSPQCHLQRDAKTQPRNEHIAALGQHVAIRNALQRA